MDWPASIGVQRAQHQMAGFRGGERDLHRAAVAHFTHENHLRRLAQRGTQTVWENRHNPARVRAG